MLWLLLACKTDCPPGSTLGDDGLCYLSEDTAAPAEALPDCGNLTWQTAGQPYLLTYCTGCHSSGVTGEWRREAPEGVDFETLAGAQAWSERIAARIEAGDMPPGGGAVAIHTERMLDWVACGMPGEDNPLPVGEASPAGEAMEVGAWVEEDAGELLVVRESQIGTRGRPGEWSVERFVLSGGEAWWYGYALYTEDGDLVRAVDFDPGIPLDASGDLEVEAAVEDAGVAVTEVWSVSVDVAQTTSPFDGLQPDWSVTEVVVFADIEEHGWHLSESRGTVARWSLLDDERAWSAIQIGEVFYEGEGFPLRTDLRWLERVVAPGGWSL